MQDSQVEKQAEFVESELLEWQEFVTRIEADKNVFAILDACDEPLVPPKAMELGDKAVSLYHGKAARDFAALAPYLVQVDEELADWISQELADQAWGFFVLTSHPLTLSEVREGHFRKFLMVKGPEDEELYFRFYDPRLLPNFLTSLTEEEVIEFFGACRGFAVLLGSQLRIFRPHDVQVSPN